MSEKQQVELAQNIKMIQDNMPALFAKIVVDAALHHAKYKALLKEGFTEAQSLELCKHIY